MSASIISISDSQSTAIQATERLCSVLSLFGAAFIITTFLTNDAFHKPINRLIFCAAWGNILGNVATLVGLSGIKLGPNGSLCQFQAFFIQWFGPADALWTFAMACNVYLTFFRQYDAAKLQTLEPYYWVICYGLSFIPAFTYLFVRTASRGKVYGDAGLWCWISPEWGALRVATFFGPVWIIILVTLAIYVCAGVVVFRWRDQLIANNHVDEQELGPVETIRRVSTREDDLGVGVASPDDNHLDMESQEQTKHHLGPGARHQEHSPRFQSSSSNRPTTRQANRAALNYCKMAVMFFIALFATWLPSSINLVYTLVHPNSVIFGLDIASALFLPLQGFWNAVVYIAASFPACRALFRFRFRFEGGILMAKLKAFSRGEADGEREIRRGWLRRRTESMENLTDARRQK